MGILTDNVKTYDRTYRGLRGVDFSSDHTQVIPTRFSYMQNMYKDYQSSQGIAVETIAGYRRRFVAPPEIVDGKNVAEIYGIHEWVGEVDGVQTRRVLVHAGSKLWEWKNYPKSVNVEMSGTLIVPTATSTIEGIGTFDFINLEITVAQVVSIKTADGTDITASATVTNGNIQIISSILAESDVLAIVYKEGVLTASDTPLRTGMNTQKSISFSSGDMSYILSGRDLLKFDYEEVDYADFYTPTLVINKVEGTDEGTLYEQQNLLNWHEHNLTSCITDGVKKTFTLSKHIDGAKLSLNTIKLFGIRYQKNRPEFDDYMDFTISGDRKSVTFATAPRKSEEGIKSITLKCSRAAGDKYITINAESNMYEQFKVVGFSAIDEPIYEFGSSIVLAVMQTTQSTDYVGKTVHYGSGVVGEDWTVTRVSFFEANEAGLVLCGDPPNNEFTSKLVGGIDTPLAHCTLHCGYDGRDFVTGSPRFPNVVFYTTRQADGTIDATYFGGLSYFKVGRADNPITALMVVGDTLVILKKDNKKEAAIYYYTGQDTTDNINPRIYVGGQGLGGLGCVGDCVNFLDDPIFVSRLGIEAIGQLSVRLERAVEHRSSLIDQRLLNLDLTKAQLAEWNGYMAVLVDGQIFLADSRQMYRNEQGILQYEWYYLNDIGVYEGQFYEYKYAKEISEAVSASTIEYEGIEYPIELIADETLYGTVANEISEADGTDGAIFESKAIPIVVDDTTVYVEIYCKIDTVNNKAYLCERAGNKTGGVFKPATYIKNIDDNIFFGTNNGAVCSFNFDMRGTDGEIPTKYYTFDDRTIVSGCATCMDNCDIPNLTKSTVKKSVVLKTKSFGRSAVKVKVRTNRKNYTAIENEVKPYNLFERINNSVFDFDSVDFSDMSFNTFGQSLFTLHEREKQWVEKQFYIYSDEYMRPFGFYYLSYRFTVAGKLKA